MEGKWKDPHLQQYAIHTIYLHVILNIGHLPARVLALPAGLGGGEVEGSTPADYTHAHMKYFYQFYLPARVLHVALLTRTSSLGGGGGEGSSIPAEYTQTVSMPNFK